MSRVYGESKCVAEALITDEIVMHDGFQYDPRAGRCRVKTGLNL